MTMRMPQPGARDFPAGQARHGDIEQHEIGLKLLRHGKAFIAVARAVQDKAERFEQTVQQRKLIGIIIDQQNAAHRAVIAGDAAWGGCGALWRGGGV